MRKRLSLILSLAVLIQSLAGINVYAADEVIIEAEDYVACDVTVNQMPGGTASTLSCTNQPMLEYDISIAEEGVYGIYVNGANISNVSFEVYLNDTQPISYVKPSTCSDWSIYSSFKISDVKLSVGTHRLKLKPMGAIALDYIGISESVIEEKNIISADLYDESTGTVENVVTNGVDVVKASGDSALKYNIKVRNADAYTLRLNTACATDNESLQIALDGEIIKTMNIKNTSSYELFADYMCVNMYLTEGEHTLELYIDAQEAVMLKYLTLNKTSKDESLSGKQAIRKSMIDWIPGGEGVAYHETTEGADDSTMISSYLPVDVTNMSGGLKLYATGGEWYKYSINVPETGMYDIKLCSYSTFAISGSVSIDDGKAHSISIPISEDWGVFTPHSQVKLKLEAGEHIVKFEFDSRGFHSDYFELTKVVEDFEVYAVFANDKALIGENKAIRGTEKIDIYFTDILNASTSVNVELSDGENVIPTECVIEDNVISVLLHSSLDYNSEYFINISGAKSESGISYTQNETVSFMTDGESNDSGVGVIAEASAKIDDNVMTAEGRIENGLGINMAGRGVWATLKNGSKTYTTDKVYTQEGGIFTLNYTMPSDAPDGDYTVKVFTEYNLAGKSFTLNYVSEATMNTIISDIQSTTTWEEVYNILKARYKVLGIGFRADIEDRTHNIDDEAFCSHFIGKTYLNKKDFLKNYYEKLAFENFNQSTTAEHAKKHLTNESICGYLGVDFKKAELVVNNGDALYGAVANLASYTDAAELRDDINSLIDDYLIIEFNISKPVMSVNSASTYVGRKVSTGLNFTNALQNVLKITYKIECPTEAIASSTAVDIQTSNKADVTVSGKTITTVVTPNEDFIDNQEFNLSTTIGTAGTYTFGINADVEYKTGTESVIVSADQVNASIVVRENTQDGTSGNGGGNGGGGNRGGNSTGSFSPIIIPQPEKPEEKVTFSDLSNVSWAEESIKELLDAGIISMADDNKFRPDDFVTREEFVKMAILAFNIFDENAKADFSDVASDAWYVPYVASAANSGVVFGRNDGTFGIGENISREDMAVIISRILKNTDSSNDENFSDDDDISAYAKDAVYQMKSLGIINGVGNNMFAPKELATRAMAAKIIATAMKEVTR